MIDQQCEADQEKFNKLRLLLVCIFPLFVGYYIVLHSRKFFLCLLCALPLELYGS